MDSFQDEVTNWRIISNNSLKMIATSKKRKHKFVTQNKIHKVTIAVLFGSR